MVTFIIPPSGFLIDEKVFATLGVLKVAAVLRQAGVAVDVLDFSGWDAPRIASALIDHARTVQPTAYGVTATMPQMPVAALIAEQLRDIQPSARLILGGPHATLMNASARIERKAGRTGRATAAMDDLFARFDVVVAGDGEHAIGQALAPGAPRLIDADDPTSTLFLTRADLDAAPFPARDLIDARSYHYRIDGAPAQSLIAQLGCPFGCTFCGGRKSPFLRRVRTRTSAAVIAEMRHLYEVYGTTGFMFFDDELNVNTAFGELLALMVTLQEDLGAEFRMRGLLKSELVTPEMAHAMYRAGFRQVLVGFESGHPQILENMQKRATREDNTRCVGLLKDAGLHVKALMSLGHAGESVDTIAATKRWLLEVQPDDFDATVMTVYPGTPYWDDAVETAPGCYTYTAKNGDRLHGRHVDHLKDENFYKGIPGGYQAFVHTDTLTADDLVALRDDLEASVRAALGIAYPSAAAAVNYEHSMGQR